MSRARMEAKARALAEKFYKDAQAVFDDPRMTETVYDGDVMQALLTMQQDAEDVRDSE